MQVAHNPVSGTQYPHSPTSQNPKKGNISPRKSFFFDLFGQRKRLEGKAGGKETKSEKLPATNN